MRVSPVGWAFADLDAVLREAESSAAVTHNHPEGIKGAQAVAVSISLARSGRSKEEIRSFVTQRFGYDLTRTVSEVRRTYSFNESCQGTVPEALIAFFDSTDFESAVRGAISLGGDADTIGCITGAVAHAFYKSIPTFMVDEALARLPTDLKQVFREFEATFGSGVERP